MKRNLFKLGLCAIVSSCLLFSTPSFATNQADENSGEEIVDLLFEDTQNPEKIENKTQVTDKKNQETKQQQMQTPQGQETKQQQVQTNQGQDIKQPQVQTPQAQETKQPQVQMTKQMQTKKQTKPKPAVKLETVNDYFIGTFRLYDEQTGKTYDFQANKAFTYDYKKPVPPLIVDKSSFDIFVSQIEQHFEVKGEKTVLYPQRVGNSNKYELVQQKLNQKIIDSKKFEQELARRIKVADYTPVKIPFLSTAQLEKKALEKEIVLLSQYTTKYNAHDVGRTANVELAAKAIHGTKLAPNEKFYYNSRIQGITPHLRVAKIIVNNEFVDGVGGGLCQVSTTLFNTALESGLQIDHRRNHSLPVNYVPRGRDAMVSNSNDFVFTNNFKNDIYIMYEKSASNAITFKIYGSKEDKKNMNIWVNGGGSNYSLHRKIDGSPVMQTFYSHYQ